MTGDGLGLGNLTTSDPAFANGMTGKSTGNLDLNLNLNDPLPGSWDPPFGGNLIHGILKVAGTSPEIINSKLNEIKSSLGHPTLIVDIAAQSLPTSANSRVDSQVRPKAQGLNGREQ